MSRLRFLYNPCLYWLIPVAYLNDVRPPHTHMIGKCSLLFSLLLIATATADPSVRLPENAIWNENISTVFTKPKSDLDDYILQQKISCFADQFRIEVFGGGRRQLLITFNGSVGAAWKDGVSLPPEMVAPLLKAYRPRFLLKQIATNLPSAKLVRSEWCAHEWCDLLRMPDGGGGQISLWVSVKTRLAEHLVNRGSDGQITIVDFSWIDLDLEKPPSMSLSE